jgi:exodeoxyribonuclease III
MKKIISWNVNGIRAMAKKGFVPWIGQAAPDVLCLQETKANPDQLDEELKNIHGYTSYFASAEKKGYSGVAIYTKAKPTEIRKMGFEEFDREGRVLVLEYPDLTVISAYFPNSQNGGARLGYKLEFCAAMLEFCEGLAAAGRNFVLCGDFNIAHKPIDLARPKGNEASAGYLPEERAWMDTFTGSGFIDTFRLFNQEPGNYTWWSYVTRARERNVGWRLDYHCVPGYFQKRVAQSTILSDVMGSDHCPVELILT